jgi:hypothetical protein
MINFLNSLKFNENTDIDSLIYIIQNEEISILSEKIIKNIINDENILVDIEINKKYVITLSIIYTLIKPRLMDPIDPTNYYNSSDVLNEIIFFIEKYYIFYLNKIFSNQEKNMLIKFLLMNIDNFV